MKAYPELYEGEDINAYYTEFKALNNLNGRKLNRGQELKFPHTRKSKEIHDAKIAEAARAARAAKAAAKRERAAVEAAENPEEPSEELSLFGSDTRSNPEAEKRRAEARREEARHKAVHDFQHAQLPLWVYSEGFTSVENESMDALMALAREKVDASFAEALVLHRYPDKNICILEFEEPKKLGEFFFFAIKVKEDGGAYCYSLEKGISFFGVGDESILLEWRTAWNFSDLGGRTYKDLSGFLKELEAGRPVKSDGEDDPGMVPPAS